MNASISLQQIKKDLQVFQNQCVIVYGSWVSGEYITGRSDIDVALVTHSRKASENLHIWKEALGKVANQYDIRVFELLPLFLQTEILQSYQVVFGDPLELSEYFYGFRKLWRDMVGRVEKNQFSSVLEKISLIKSSEIHGN